MPPFIFCVFSFRGGYYTTLSHNIIHYIFVLFTFAKVEVISLVWYFGLRQKFSITTHFAYQLGLGPSFVSLTSLRLWSQQKIKWPTAFEKCIQKSPYKMTSRHCAVIIVLRCAAVAVDSSHMTAYHPLRGVDSVHLQILLMDTCQQCWS